MKKESKEQTNKKKRIIMLITVIALIGIIVGSIVIRNVVVNQETEGENYLAGGNASSELLARYIQKGITIGGITGTLESLDTSDATAKPEDILEGKTAYVNGVKITGTRIESTLGTVTGNEKTNTTVNDKYGNKIVVPAGFRVVNQSDTVEDGIIIEDVSAKDNNTKGSQFVWIPVGGIKTSQGEKEIILGRYTFDDSGNKKLVQSAENYANETQLKEESTSSDYYQELLNTTSSRNTKAKDIAEFVTKTLSTGGYYIGRYEAGDALATNTSRTSSSSDTNPIVCKTGIYPYNCITQPQAASLCQNMYSSNSFTSDLINSYAWDTAIVFIQECSGDKDYSRQNRLQTTIAKCGEATDGANKDVRCNIYDMSGNTFEWSTETNSGTTYPCVTRGGLFNNSNVCTSGRYVQLYDRRLRHICVQNNFIFVMPNTCLR